MILLLRPLLLWVYLTTQAFAASLPLGISEITSIEGITEYRLDNGLRVLLAPDQSKPTTTVNMTYLVGSKHENYGQTGMAHLLEHMLFKGTPTIRYALAEFSKRGLQANGSTSNDRTNYYASFAADRQTLEWYLSWQADAMVHSLIAKEDLNSEMTVVRNEMEEGENRPFQVLLQKMGATAYTWHNYSKSTIGARSDVENVDIAQLQAFYRQYYQPDNAVLILSGRFDVAEVLNHIANTFGKLAKSDRKLPPQYTVEPVQDGERKIVVRRTGGTPLVAAAYHIPSAAHPDYDALSLAVTILADEDSGRLSDILIPTKLASKVFGFAWDRLDPSIAVFGAELQNNMEPEKTLKKLTAVLESNAQYPFTSEELERARRQWLKKWNKLYSDSKELGVALSEYIAIGDWRLFFLSRDRVQAFKLKDIQSATQKYLLTSNRTEGIYIPVQQPKRAPALKTVEVKALFKDYHGQTNFKQVQPFNTSPENIHQSTQYTTLDLPNGLVKLALLPKPTRGNQVHAKLMLSFGDVQSLRGKQALSIAVAQLIDQGTHTFTRQQFKDKLDVLQADISFTDLGNEVQIGLSTIDEHLPALISLVLNALRTANFPQDRLDEYKQSAITAIQSAMTKPQALAHQTLARQNNPWPKDDLRYIPTFEESIKNIQALSRHALIKFHQHFYGAGTIEFAAVGAFDPKAVQQALKTALQGWRRAPAYTRIPHPYRRLTAQNFQIETPDYANAYYEAAMPVALQDIHPDYPALLLGNFLLGNFPASRLWQRVRDQEGLSYTVKSDLSISCFEPTSLWTIHAIYAPEHKGRLEKAVQEVLARLVTEGFTEAEINTGKVALLKYRDLMRAQDETLVSVLSDYLALGRTYTWTAKIDQKISALTAAEVNTTIRKYLKPEAFSIATAGNFKN